MQSASAAPSSRGRRCRRRPCRRAARPRRPWAHTAAARARSARASWPRPAAGRDPAARSPPRAARARCRPSAASRDNRVGYRNPPRARGNALWQPGAGPCVRALRAGAALGAGAAAATPAAFAGGWNRAAAPPRARAHRRARACGPRPAAPLTGSSVMGAPTLCVQPGPRRVVANASQVHRRARLQVAPARVPVYGDLAVALGVRAHTLRRRDVLRPHACAPPRVTGPGAATARRGAGAV